MNKLKAELKKIYEEKGMTGLQRHVGFELDYIVFVSLGNSFLPDDVKKHDDFINIDGLPSKFIAENLVKEWSNEIK
ncbi:hypothetical protein PANI_CDS0026 [Maribacter phage Panino]